MTIVHCAIHLRCDLRFLRYQPLLSCLFRHHSQVITVSSHCVSIQGVEGWDVDLPTGIEANAVVHTVAKIGWMIVYILVYGIRPLIIRPKPVGLADVINWGLVLSFDGVLLYTLGFKSLLYLLLGTVFGGGLHPIAGHLIQEHYMFVTVRNVRY